ERVVPVRLEGGLGDVAAAHAGEDRLEGDPLGPGRRRGGQPAEAERAAAGQGPERGGAGESSRDGEPRRPGIKDQPEHQHRVRRRASCTPGTVPPTMGRGRALPYAFTAWGAICR